MIHLEEKNILLSIEKKMVNELIKDCQKFDNLHDMPYLDNAFNFYPDMPAFVLAYSEKQVIGFVSIYANQIDEANLTIYVAPDYRKQGIGKKLFNQAKKICKKYQYVEVVVQLEQNQLNKMPGILNSFNLRHDKSFSEILMSFERHKLLTSTNKIKVEKLQQQQINELAKIHAFGFLDDYEQVKEDLEISFNDEAIEIYAFFNENNLIGSVTFEIIETNKAHLFGYVIKRELQGFGYGQQALNEVLKIMQKKEIKHLNLTVAKDNLNARHVYQKHGFVEKTTLEYLVGSI